MIVAAITPTHPACYGMCCPIHGRCARYQAVELMTSTQSAVVTCETTCGARPLFLQATPTVAQRLDWLPLAVPARSKARQARELLLDESGA